MRFGTDTYRRGALERLEDARLLREKGHYSAAFYFAGLSVEGMLRALVWLRDKQFDERHDLRRLATRVRDLGLLRAGDRDDDFGAKIQGIVRTWANSLRFAGDDQLIRWLLKTGEIRGGKKNKQHRDIKMLCEEQFNYCHEVVKRCEALCQRHRKPN